MVQTITDEPSLVYPGSEDFRSLLLRHCVSDQIGLQSIVPSMLKLLSWSLALDGTRPLLLVFTRLTTIHRWLEMIAWQQRHH